jgi:hypothetical protein
MTSIQLEKWHLADNGSITGWVPQKLHTSDLYSALRTSPLKACYTGKTNGIQLHNTSDDGFSIVDGLTIEYQYSIPLTQLKQRKVKWQWQGLYNDIIVEFNIEQHIYEYTYEQKQTLKEINDIITKLNEPPKAKYLLHNFRLSECIILCQNCGELLADLKKRKTDYLPPCLAYNL